LRSVFRLTRLAVTLATQPFSKRSRALAMSISPENTGVPIASMRSTGCHDHLHQVDVVDHQVEHDIDVGAALLERRQAVALDEARRVAGAAPRPGWSD
jgi:hypothetical protein